jgi:uncharacterized membrane protein
MDNLAFVTSFFTILIMWVNHHRLFTHIGRCDERLLFYNGLLYLGCVSCRSRRHWSPSISGVLVR